MPFLLGFSITVRLYDIRLQLRVVLRTRPDGLARRLDMIDTGHRTRLYSPSGDRPRNGHRRSPVSAPKRDTRVFDTLKTPGGVRAFANRRWSVHRVVIRTWPRDKNAILATEYATCTVWYIRVTVCTGLGPRPIQSTAVR